MPSANSLEFIRSEPRKWLVTGCAGVIGSHIVEALLELDQDVVGLDNLATGSTTNLDLIQEPVSESQWQRFTFHLPVKDLAQANLLAGVCAKLDPPEASFFNVASSKFVSLNQFVEQYPDVGKTYPIEGSFARFSSGDIWHSCADTSRGTSILEFEPQIGLKNGLVSTFELYEGEKLKFKEAI